MTDSARPVETHDVSAVNSKQGRELYQSRVKIFPKRGHGFFRSLKWKIMIATLLVYYVTPWIRWDRGPHAPDQAVLVDLANRRFYFFFIEIWPQEFYYVAGLLIMAGIGLFLVTSTVGRAWCGYACPQTVWVDLFLVIERWIEGDRNARIKLDKAPYDAVKIRKRTLKHGIWLLIAISTGGAWVFYFADAPSLLVSLFTGQAPFVAYATIGVLTFTTYVLGGLMREQVCTYMCPWPRIQGAMLDSDSLTVTYNDWRGEPRARGKKRAEAEGAKTGDCVDCNACVVVCPMGIDIRDGQQLECITCALCIDACNSVMEKLDRPQGLISYSTFREYDAHKAGKDFKASTWRSVIRPRTFAYFALWAAIGLGMLLVLVTRDRLDVNVLRDRNPVFVTLKNGDIRNGYTVKILNMIAETREFEIALDGFPAAQFTIPGIAEEPTRKVAVHVEPDQVRAIKIYVAAPRAALEADRTGFDFQVRDVANGAMARYDAVFIGPQ